MKPNSSNSVNSFKDILDITCLKKDARYVLYDYNDYDSFPGVGFPDVKFKDSNELFNYLSKEGLSILDNIDILNLNTFKVVSFRGDRLRLLDRDELSDFVTACINILEDSEE